MFATLLGGLPRPPLSDGLDPSSAGALDALVELVVRAQEDAGLEPITDGRLRDAELIGDAGAVVEGWAVAARLTDRAVKQALTGPYSAGWRAVAVSEPGGGGGNDRVARTLEAADAANDTMRRLAAAGCPLVEIEETEAHRVGGDPHEQSLFREAHARLTAGVAGAHLSLSIVGGSAADAGVETIVAPAYASLAVDLIAGPDNWNLVTRLAGDRGVVVGALSAGDSDEPKEVLLWGTRYAASTAGRGLARVGLGSAGSWANLTWDVALRKLNALGTAARLAALPPGEELAAAVDPRSISSRQGALGRAAAGHDHGHRR